MKYPFKSLLLAATVLAAASCAKDDTQSGGEETAGPVIVNASPAAIGGEIILKLKTEASGIVEKSRAQGVSKGSGIDEIDRILNTVNTVRFERLFPDGGRFEERTRREGLHLWYYAKYDPSVPTSEMASLLSSCKDIEIIEYSLAANMWVNEAELNGTPGVDDDGNGYVDDIYGYNFTKETGELDFSAELMHGTHVAGTIAAVNNNGVGVCGIAGGSGRGDGVKIMSCEILGKSESGSSGAGLAGHIRAIKYAADNGAVICQNSWGYTAGTISVTDWTRGSYSALSRAMEYFNKYAGLDENGNQTGPMAGGIVLFAAGNDASSEVCYPAADANAISVGATAFTGAPAYYTNYGTWVQISAPGGDQMLSNAYGGVYSTSVAADGSSGYEGSQGTSMACPHVSGACALAVSYYYGAEKRKGLTGEMLRQALLSSTQSVDRYCTGKYQQYLGNMGIGSLDTYKLLRNIAKIDGIPTQRVGVGDTVSIDLSNHFTATNVLGYTVSVPDLVKIELRGGVMKLTGLKKGRTTIIVSDGAAIRKPIEVTVE